MPNENMDGYTDAMRDFAPDAPKTEALTAYELLSDGGLQEADKLAKADEETARKVVQLLGKAIDTNAAYRAIAARSGELYLAGNAAAAAEFTKLDEVPK